MKKIPSIRKAKYAVYLNEEHAFTLIEMLLAFSVFIIIIFFISPIFQLMLNTHLEDRIQAMEWEVFCSQMKKEIRMSTNVQIKGNTLVLTEDAGTVVYEPYGNSIRRRVNYTGHEILLQNVTDLNFTLLKNSVKTDVKDLSGKDYSFVSYSYLDWNGAPL